MGKPVELKMVENQVIMRTPNKKVAEGLADLKRMAEEDNQVNMVPGINDPVNFYCECSDEECHERIRMRPATYEKIHKDSKCFIVRPGHVVPDIEEVTKSNKTYEVVRKFKEPPQKVDSLNKTPLHNH